ncbi:MAG: hypothetical protein Q4G68_11910 [Planctomycetia bacterium]|nr:hypothetical protein [Planctomycetia bacterium]
MPERRDYIPENNRSPQETAFVAPCSFFISLGLHAIAILLTILIVQSLPSKGTVNGNSDDRTVGIVFSKEEGYTSPEETLRIAGGTESASDSPEDAPASSPADSLMPSLDAVGLNASGTPNDTNAPAGNSPAAALLPGTGESGSGSGQGDGQSVGFASLRGKGRKFVYVLDHSESMKWPDGQAMTKAIAEAKKSLLSLDPVQGAKKFQVICYNHEVKVFDAGRLLDVTEPNKQRACKFLDTLFPEGGTDPLAALEKAVTFRPDVIFFLTDADEEIPSANLARIHDAAVRNKVGQIHVFEFRRSGAPEKKSFARLAADNGGGYFCELLP